MAAQHARNEGGSITLTCGIDVDHPIRHASNAVASNAAVEGFVRGAAIELARGIRINVVTPGLLTESKEAYGHLFPGFETVPAWRWRTPAAWRGRRAGRFIKSGKRPGAYSPC